MKIAFYVSHFTLRGSEIATYDYARYCEEILDHQSIILYQPGHPSSLAAVEAKFGSRFQMVQINSISEIDRALEKEKADLFYALKNGARDGVISHSRPNAIHAVFPTKSREFHGERFAFVSKWLSDSCSSGQAQYVPHIVDLPANNDDLRNELAISRSAMVFGTYGGSNSFNIKFAREAVRKTLERRREAYFLFMNTTPFLSHPRAIFLPGTTDSVRKVQFINSCDAMIHARRVGESFGIACGEFSIRNKPVITYKYSPQKSHLDILGDKAIRYSSQRELEQILLNLSKPDVLFDCDCYSKQFSPASVMSRFSSVFLTDADPRPDKAPGLSRRLAALFKRA